MVGLADIRRWRPDALGDVAGDLNGHIGTMIGVGDRLDQVRTPPGWRGMAAQAAELTASQLASGIREAAFDAGSVHRATGEAAKDVAAVQTLLRDTDALAAENGLAISPDGVVTEARPLAGLAPDQMAGAQAQRERARDMIEARIAQIVTTGRDIDTKLARVLRGVDTTSPAAMTPVPTAAAAAAGEAQGGLTAPPAPPNGTPAQNAAWWGSLSPDEQAAVVRDHPVEIGGMDGIPRAARSQANMSRIDGERAALEHQLAVAMLQAPVKPGSLARDPDHRVKTPAVEEIEAKIASLNTITGVMSLGGRQLLLLDTRGRRVKAAVAVGNIDTANNVAVFTPGLGSTVDGRLKEYDNNMNQLAGRSNGLSARYGRGEQTAAVTWLGYEAPQPSEILEPSHSTAGTSDAETAAPALNRFYGGIDASTSGHQHLVAMGHSYGSTVTGFALRRPSPVSDTILFGSPGAGDATSAGQLHGGHINVLEAKDDIVADLGAFGTDPNNMPGVNNLDTSPHDLPTGEHLDGSEWHSEYLTDHTTSQYNIAAIVSGHPERAIPAHNTMLGANGGLGDAARNAYPIGPGH